MKNILILAALCLTVAACKCERSDDSPEHSATLVKGTKKALKEGDEFCLLRGSPSWHIYARPDSSFDSGVDHDFEIIKAWPVLSTLPHVRISTHDYIQLSYDQGSGGVTLKHRHYNKGTFKYERSAILLPEGAGGVSRWYSGPVLSGGSEQGKYYVFQLTDTPSCKHHDVTGPCRRFHFEYFGRNDNEAIDHRPEDARNVVEYNANTCGGGFLQTTEGDGDHGPSAP